MKVTSKTRWSSIAPLWDTLTEDSRKELQQAAQARFGNYYDLTIDQLFELLSGDFSGVLGDINDETVLQVVWAKGFAEFFDNMSATLDHISIKPDAMEIRAQAGTLKMSFQEVVLIFCRDYFGLPSFNACGTLTVSEFLLAKRSAYNIAVAQRNMRMIQEQKFKKR